MPLLYGEGERAFLRLQEEILHVDEDYTLFAWTQKSRNKSLLASSLRDFQTFTPQLDPACNDPADITQIDLREDLSKNCFSVYPPPSDRMPPQLTSRGLYLTLPLRNHEGGLWHALLSIMCFSRGDTCLLLCATLNHISDRPNKYVKESFFSDALVFLPESMEDDFRYMSFYVDRPTHNGLDLLNPKPEDLSPPTLELKLDPALIPELTCIASNMVHVRSFGQQYLGDKFPFTEQSFPNVTMTSISGQPPWKAMPSSDVQAITHFLRMEDRDPMRVLVDLPELCYTPAFRNRDNTFRFKFGRSGGVDLMLDVGIRDKLWVTPELISVIDTDSRDPYLCATDQCNQVDRATIHTKFLTAGEHHVWNIKISIRPAGAITTTPNSQHFVLTLTRVLKSE
jgi:hypothetical protein